MSSKRYKDAEEIYREDLLNWPKNGFALNGLYESLKAQGRTAESEEVKKQFTDAWTYADSPLKNSRIDKDKRSNLTLKINEDSPNTLIYLANAICMTN